MVAAWEKMKAFFKEHSKLALAFSGGTDSAFLLYAAVKCGAEVKAYYVKSSFQPAFELEDARRLAEELSAPMEVIELDVLSVAQIVSNPPERCYHCKRAIFSAITGAAERDNFSLIIDGSNASDDPADRPGMRALKELMVRSPLRECGLTKADVRAMSKAAGLFTHDKPAYACLATRIPTGQAITAQKLENTERGENYLFSLGLRDFRVRLGASGEARIQLRAEDMPKLVEKAAEVSAELGKYYKGVLLDLEVRNEQ